MTTSGRDQKGDLMKRAPAEKAKLRDECYEMYKAGMQIRHVAEVKDISYKTTWDYIQIARLLERDPMIAPERRTGPIHYTSSGVVFG